jgi:hypothetical protein
MTVGEAYQIFDVPRYLLQRGRTFTMIPRPKGLTLHRYLCDQEELIGVQNAQQIALNYWKSQQQLDAAITNAVTRASQVSRFEYSIASSVVKTAIGSVKLSATGSQRGSTKADRSPLTSITFPYLTPQGEFEDGEPSFGVARRAYRLGNA